MRKMVTMLVWTVVIMMCVCGEIYGGGEEGRLVTSVGVTGNEQIVSEYIMGVVRVRAGEMMSRDIVLKDIEAIFEQVFGEFFSYVDAEINEEIPGVNRGS